MDTETLLKYISDDLPEAERESVYRQICGSEDNMREYRAMRRLYDISLWRTDPAPVPRRMRQRHAPRRGMALTWALGVLSAVCISVTVAVLASRPSTGRMALGASETVTAPSGSSLHLTLRDGTAVWLNSNSTLRMEQPSGRHDRTRRVSLSGEAYFEVAKDPKRPFIVETSSLDVTVLGTEFNISAYEGDVWTASLIEGAVSVSDKGGRELAALRPMMQASYDGCRLSVTRADRNSSLWREGILYFDNMTLADIFGRMSRYYDLNMDVSCASGLDRRFTGKFRLADGYEHILKVLQIEGGFSYEIESVDGSVTVRLR